MSDNLLSGAASESAPVKRTLPANPDLHHLREEARDLLNSGHAPTLAKAQFSIATSYGFASWPKLKVHVESLRLSGQLKAAIDANDLPAVISLMTAHPDLHRAPLGYNQNGPLTYVAECRAPHAAVLPDGLKMARWMIAHGSDVHQGGECPLMRAAMDDAGIPMMELLVGHGANVNARWNGATPIVFAPCDTLAAGALRWLLTHGADVNKIALKYGNPLFLVLGTTRRDASARKSCFKAFAEMGVPLPDTPTMALHGARIDLLENFLKHDPSLLSRRFSTEEIYPAELGFKPGDGHTATPLDSATWLHISYPLRRRRWKATATPLNGTTWLHMAAEYDDVEMAEWLIDRGADVNARATINAEGFGGHTPLFHTVVSMRQRDDAMGRLLLKHGADSEIRAAFRGERLDSSDSVKLAIRECRDVTATEYARQYREPRWVSEAVLDLITERVGDG